METTKGAVSSGNPDHTLEVVGMTERTGNFERVAAMMDTVPRFDEDAKQLAVELSRQLARGEPVQRESLAAALGVPTSEITTLLEGEQLKG